MPSHLMSNPERHMRETAKKILTHPVKINTAYGAQTMSLMEADHLVATGQANPADLERGFVRAVNLHANPDAAAAASPAKARKITPKMLAAQAMSKVVLSRVHEKLKAQGCNIRKMMFDEWAVEQRRESRYEAWAAKALPAVQSGAATPGEAAAAVAGAVTGQPVAPTPTGAAGARRGRGKRKGESEQTELPLSTETKTNGRRRRMRHNPGMFGVVENDGKFHLTGPDGSTMGKYYMTQEKADLEAAKLNARMS